MTMSDPLTAIRAELERVKGWEQTFHAKQDGRGFCDACCCRWPCTEQEIAQDAARMARALETLVPVLEAAKEAATYAAATVSAGNRTDLGDGWVRIHGGRADSSYHQLSHLRDGIRAALADIAKLLTGDPANG